MVVRFPFDSSRLFAVATITFIDISKDFFFLMFFPFLEHRELTTNTAVIPDLNMMMTLSVIFFTTHPTKSNISAFVFLYHAGNIVLVQDTIKDLNL